jgi:hypothetical protein
VIIHRKGISVEQKDSFRFRKTARSLFYISLNFIPSLYAEMFPLICSTERTCLRRTTFGYLKKETVCFGWGPYGWFGYGHD